MEPLVEFLKDYLPERWHIIAFVGAASLLFVYYFDNFLKCRQMKIKMINRKARAIAGIEKLRRIVNIENIKTDITELSFEELRRRLKEGQLKSIDVLRAYQAKAIEVNDRTNAITDVIPGAEILASEADRKCAEDRGPLHGIPISLKECCGVKGLDCTAGFGTLIDTPYPDDSVILKALKASGAIPFIRTNIPQGMASYSTDNPIYGLTSNPINNQRSPGGSSGGEGAMLGGKGSILGVGSDIGGSVRIPAHFCGVAALKPTPSRISTDGNFGYGTKLGGQTLVLPSYGPMGRDVDSLVQFMKAVLGPTMFELDPQTPPIPFNTEVFESKRPLTIGFYTYDGCVQSVPSVVRAVKIAKFALEKMGHKLVQFHPPDVQYALRELFYPAFFGDEMEGYIDLVKHDNTCETLYPWVKFCRYPYFVRWIIAKWNRITCNDPLSNELLSRPVLRSVTAWQNKCRAMISYQLKFSDTWKDKGLDLVICPCMPSLALKHGLDKKLIVAVSYTALYNVLAYPAGTLPIDKVTTMDVYQTKHYKPVNDLEKKIKEDIAGSEGMPVGIQVVGLPFREEKVLRVMKDLETHLKSYV